MAKRIIEQTCDLYRVDGTSVKRIADEFNEELDRALDGEKSTLQILPSFLSAPSGREEGYYLAVDFGGSNLRVMLVGLQGQGSYEMIDQISKPLKDPQGRYDYTTADTSGREVFAFIADLAAEVWAKASPCKLGLTFSYPMQQDSICSARLLRWTKELKLRQTVGRDIGQMLGEALRDKGIDLRPAAIINDTVGVFLAGCYCDPAVCAGSICGTGHNTCYLEPSRVTSSNQVMIVNTEAGNFSPLPGNGYDQILDKATDDPGQQNMEKMVSGKYLGELMRITLTDLGQKGYLPGYDPTLRIWCQPYSLPTEVLGWLGSKRSAERQQLANWAEENGIAFNQDGYSCLNLISTAILERAMKLIASTYIAILKRNRQLNDKRQVIAVDGALFKNVPGFLAGIESILQRELPDRAISLIYTADGSSVGAAVAAALAEDHICADRNQR
ncbi:hexokinase [hydrocarbon metagenome]|uniref:Hexokinase n=1 Tax=hydrocarbon metagenome TaxID=938273 RepID=A0A0W8E3Y9_9ZZZZ